MSSDFELLKNFVRKINLRVLIFEEKIFQKILSNSLLVVPKLRRRGS